VQHFFSQVDIPRSSHLDRSKNNLEVFAVIVI